MLTKAKSNEDVYVLNNKRIADFTFAVDMYCHACLKRSRMRYYLDDFGWYYAVCGECSHANSIKNPKYFKGYVGSNE